VRTLINEKLIDMNKSVNCILVTPHGRSGSLFFQSLFDGHNQIVTFPGFGVSYFFPQSILNVETALDEFISEHFDVFDSSKGYLGKLNESVTTLFGPDQNKHLFIDALEFRKNALDKEFRSWVDAQSPLPRKDFVIGLHSAFARTIGQNPSEIKYILIHAHGYDGSHDRALYDFPNLFYVAMVRDPREDWFSWRKVVELRNGTGSAAGMIVDRNRSIISYADYVYKLYLFSLKLPLGHLRIIDLNRFHELNRDAMISLADYFGIVYKDVLLNSTFLGVVWWGNSADRLPISGFDPKKIPYNWSSKLSKFDEAAISSVLMEPIRMLGYPIGSYDKKFRLRTSCKDICNWCLVYFNARIRGIAERNSFQNKVLRRIPLVLAKTLYILYLCWSVAVMLAKFLYVGSRQPDCGDLVGRGFNRADFL